MNKSQLNKLGLFIISSMAEKTLEQKYKALNDREHVLLRPGMYIGSIVSKTSDTFVFNNDTNKFEIVNLTYNPGFLKLFDEIISNSIDESKRNKKLNLIKVKVDTENGCISVYDNGGIPVEIHKEKKQYIPEMIFSNLKAGSNFDDNDERDVVGTNGIGSTAVNIFSTKFIVTTADRKNKYKQIFYENMAKRFAPKIEKSKEHFTEIEYYPDLKRFGMDCIDGENLAMIEKRVYEAAACNPNVTIEFSINGENKTIKFKTFKDYIDLYCDNVMYEESKDWQIGIGESLGTLNNISYVNGVFTYDGGTHCNYIANQIINYLREKIKKKYKVDVKPNELRQHFSLFINCTIINPAFSSQTKEKLITEQKNFGTEHTISEKLLKQVFSSEIVQCILDWAKKKSDADEAATLRKLQKSLDKTKIPKLIDAKKKGLRDDCIFQIYEGDSASSSVRKYRDPQLQGAFPIRGKFLNVYDLDASKVMQNEEVKHICAALGLKIGERATNRTLRYGKIAIYTDSDFDGFGISGLLLNFFYKYWPELVKDGRIYQSETPIVVAKKGKEVLKFYYDNEYKEWMDKVGKDISKWNVEYKKGLAALEDSEYKEIIQNPRLYQFTEDDLSKEQFAIWFGEDSQPRKDKILGKELTLPKFINKPTHNLCVPKECVNPNNENIEPPIGELSMVEYPFLDNKDCEKVVEKERKINSNELKNRLKGNIQKGKNNTTQGKKPSNKALF